MRTRDFLPPPDLDIRGGRSMDSCSTTLRLKNENCSTMLSVDETKQEFGLNEISTCPWTVSLNIDPDRIPSSIPEAECSCDQCVQYDGECSRSRRRPCYSYKGRCEKVLSSKVVIRRHCNQITGVYEYTSGLLPVAVGCTCSQELVVLNKLAKSRRKINQWKWTLRYHTQLTQNVARTPLKRPQCFVDVPRTFL